jgi:hypothetical protein
MISLKYLYISSIIVIFTSVTSYAQNKLDPSMATAHAGSKKHDGLALRLSLGFGYSSSSESYEGNDFSVYGVSAPMSIAIGYTVTENLIINADIFGAGVINPTFKLNGQSASLDNTSITHAAFGVGFTYYIMPSNMYIAGSIGCAQSQLKTTIGNVTNKHETEMGLGVNLMIGKEWWVSDNWGLGLAGQFIYLSPKDKNVDSYLNTIAFGLLFSATYN